MTEESNYWAPQGETFASYYDQAYQQLQNQSLDFNNHPYDNLMPSDIPPVYDPSSFPQDAEYDEEEPPLLEELEIYPDRIIQKILAVLNPFRSHGVTDDAEYLTKESDLAGPVFFYIVLAASLFLSGSKAQFGYIYGISVISCLLMYCLLNLMSAQNIFSLSTVASILGYSLIPIVGLSIIGVFFMLKGPLGALLAVVSIIWSSASASRLFISISCDKEQQPLVAYPCALVSAVYILLILF